MGYFDTHRHSEYSTFDGFGKPAELAAYAKSIGYTALGLTDHGNTNGLVKHYYGCRKAGIKPILGVEAYMLPVYQEAARGYHLCLFAKNLTGYRNINALQYEGEKQKYYNPILTFDLLRKYSTGVIATSACVQGYMAQAVLAEKKEHALRYAAEMKKIFGCDFYIEIQPYRIDSDRTQEEINLSLMEIAQQLDIPCILTSDSHRGPEEDFDTYLKLHEIAGHNLNHITDTYRERYMPSQDDIRNRFMRMHAVDFSSVKDAVRFFDECIWNLEILEHSVEDDIFESFDETLPVYDRSADSKELLKQHIVDGLKKRGKCSRKYLDRVKLEYDIITRLHFEDYFLIVEDYVKWAKDHDIVVGPGRGSGCNFLVNYALGITEVDSLKFDLEPRRFLMEERAKMPDIDIDFETERRGEVISYLLEKYKGKSARICSYGLYKIDNLVNDLAKVCGLPCGAEEEESVAQENKQIIASIKSFIRTYEDADGNVDVVQLAVAKDAEQYNRRYDNIIRHFCKLYKKVRYIGTHAAGVAITDADILERTSLRIIKGEVYTSYDLEDMEDIGVIKFDMLGLSTLSELKECRKLSGSDGFQEEMLEDEISVSGFMNGECDGVFQFEKNAAQKMLRNIDTSSFRDVVAVNAMNRPGPLSMKVPEQYAQNKKRLRNGETVDGSWFDEYLGKTYGTILYQEQVMRMCVELAGMGWDDAYMVSKMQIGGMNYNRFMEKDYERLFGMFLEGCRSRRIPDDVARDTFRKFMFYSFNEGHSTGYSLISSEQMYYKKHCPQYFWYAKIKYAGDENKYYKFCLGAAKDGVIIFLPHVNYSSARTSLRRLEGEDILQQGLQDINGIGSKAAAAIEKERKENGIFRNFDHFYDRMVYRHSPVNKRVIEKLKETGALQFNKNLYIIAVKKYNRALHMRR